VIAALSLALVLADATARLLALGPAEAPATDDVIVEDDEAAPTEPTPTPEPATPASAQPTSKPAVGPADTADVGVVQRPESDPTVFPDPKKFSRGFFVEGGLGPAVPLGPTSKVLSTGFSIGARTGYEIRRWVALQVHAAGMISRYDDGVLRRELLQQYTYTGELRFALPIRRFLIALQGGAGIYQLSNNLLQVAGISATNRRIGLAWDASLAFDIHSLNRHISGGFVATFLGMPALRNSSTLLLHLVLRYTL
jgi:hypothetical protein